MKENVCPCARASESERERISARENVGEWVKISEWERKIVCTKKRKVKQKSVRERVREKLICEDVREEEKIYE